MNMFDTRLIIEIMTIVFSAGVLYQRVKTCERDIADVRKSLTQIMFHLQTGEK